MHPLSAGSCLQINDDLARASRPIIKMSLELFHKVPAEAIEKLFDEQNQLLFKRADLRKYLVIRNIRDNFKEFSSHHTHPRSEIEGVGVTDTLGRAKNPHDIFINLDSAKEHQQAITGRDNEIQALEFTNKEHQQEILRLNEQISDLTANRHVACRGCFDNVLCFIKKNSREDYPYYVI